ncbi:hypothetical protein DYB32_001911 [Aphanomyces invadans]|uniref:EF-hand domain-containing protein n=1 Tax=Aphanomyces invadans TaxID=157072 RepID=A0A418B4M7_9STRA|nr:hypothetical protein DYB32_001911 [Aphanomyces invadans]
MSKAEYRLVKAKLRTACSQRRIRLEEFMKTFDVHKTKKITTEQFTRAIDASGIRLSPGEIDLLVTKYRLPDDPRTIDYRRCCDLIDKPCTIKNAEKHLTTTPSKPTKATASSSVAVQHVLVDDEALRSVKDKLATAVRTKGVVLKDVFHDFDKNNSGVVTKARFVRDLASVIGEVSLREVDAIVKAYGAGPLDVNYRQLHWDLQQGSTSAGSDASGNNSSSPRPRRRTSNQTSATDVEAVEGPLRDIVARDRIRMKNFFTDYDRMRSGKCAEGQFQRAVKVCFGALTEKDLELLVTAYSVPSTHPSHERKVDYVAFCKSVSSILPVPRDSDDERVHVDVAPLPVAPCTRDTRGDLTDAEAASWNDVMTRLSHTVATRRILLKPLFCDFDRGKTECVTCEQFARVLAMYNMFLTSADEKQAILKRYASTRLNTLPASRLAFDNKAFVNFKTFCLDLDEFQRRLSATASTPAAATPLTGHSPKADGHVSEANTQRTLPMLLRYLKQKAKRDRIRIDEYFRDCDKLRKGKITRHVVMWFTNRSQFAAGLNAAGFVLSNADVAVLSDEFKYASDRDVEGAALVAWTRFADEIDSVFTILAPEDEASVVAALQEMATIIQQQRLDIQPPFEDFDLSNQGSVSASKFQRVLSMVNLLPSNPTTTRLLTVKFSERGNAPHLGVSSTCDVNYRAFLSALTNLAPGNDASSTTVLPGTTMLDLRFSQRRYPGAREFRLRQAHGHGDPLTAESTRRHAKPAHAVALEALLKDIRYTAGVDGIWI